ncbi:MAG: DUF4136 domain-containing protein [Acidobacteriaceae bacterium]
MRKNGFFRYTGIFMFGLVAMLTLPMMAHAQSVRVNWSKRAAFSDYHTYQWVPSQNENHPFYRQYVGVYVNYDLQKKKLQQVPASQSPDLLVTYHFLTQEMMDSQTTGFGDGGGFGGYGGYGGGWGGWGMGMGGMGMGGMYDSTTSEVPRTMGILTVDIIDAKTRKIIWRGQATEDNVVKNSKGEEKDVAKSIHKMLQHYPPK